MTSLGNGHFELLVDAGSLGDLAGHIFDDLLLVCDVDGFHFGFGDFLEVGVFVRDGFVMELHEEPERSEIILFIG